MKKLIGKVGGKFADKVQVGVTHLVCKETEWEANKKKATSKCGQAKGLDIPVLKPEWLEEAEAKGAIVDELKFLIGGSKVAVQLTTRLPRRRWRCCGDRRPPMPSPRRRRR